MELLCVKQETRLKRFFCDFLQIPTITFFIARPPYTLLRDVGPSSVVRPGCHILKTKQDKAHSYYKTLQHHTEVGTDHLLPHSDPSPDASPGRYSSFKFKKNMFKY